MAQTFLANAATRLHPTEWSSGTAAGAAAFAMISNNYKSTSEMFENVGVLQEIL